jgi:hypothetical protein
MFRGGSTSPEFNYLGLFHRVSIIQECFLAVIAGIVFAGSIM